MRYASVGYELKKEEKVEARTKKSDG